MQFWVLEVFNLGCILELPGEVFTTPISRPSFYQLNQVPGVGSRDLCFLCSPDDCNVLSKLRDTGVERSTESVVHALLMPKTHHLTSCTCFWSHLMHMEGHGDLLMAQGHEKVKGLLHLTMDCRVFPPPHPTSAHILSPSPKQNKMKHSSKCQENLAGEWGCLWAL